MALFIEGMLCRLCELPMERAKGHSIRSFRPFVANRHDPLWVFNDAALHAECFARHPLATTVERCLALLEARARPWPPFCYVCGGKVAGPAEHFTFGLLTTTPDDPLYAYNFLQFHTACLRDLPGRPQMVNQLQALQSSGTWEGPGPERLLESLHAALGDAGPEAQP